MRMRVLRVPCFMVQVSVYTYWHVMLDTPFAQLGPWRLKWLEAVADTRVCVAINIKCLQPHTSLMTIIWS